MPQPPNRRKNPARKNTRRKETRGDLRVVYLVEQDADGRWNISRDGAPTGAFARSISMAIGLAYAAASAEARDTGLKATVYSVKDGKRTKEWEST